MYTYPFRVFDELGSLMRPFRCQPGMTSSSCHQPRATPHACRTTAGIAVFGLVFSSVFLIVAAACMALFYRERNAFEIKAR